jgi:hypothetical protein
MSFPGCRATRGKGLLENLLARMRARRANLLIPVQLRGGKIFDVGYGPYPLFLLHTEFAGKYGPDKTAPSGSPMSDEMGGKNVKLILFDVESGLRMHFENESFDVVTMLGVFEHIRPDLLGEEVGDILPVLKPGAPRSDYSFLPPGPTASSALWRLPAS